MIILDQMIKSKDIVKYDNVKDEEYRKTLLCQNHNTSNGSINKFVNMHNKKLKILLKNKNILKFLVENSYF